MGPGAGYICKVARGDEYDAFRDFIAFNSLIQYNGVTNFNVKIFDLVLSRNSDLKVLHSLSPLAREDHHHSALEIYSTIKAQRLTPDKSRSKYKFFCADYSSIRAALPQIDWNSLLSIGDVDN